MTIVCVWRRCRDYLAYRRRAKSLVTVSRGWSCDRTLGPIQRRPRTIFCLRHQWHDLRGDHYLNITTFLGNGVASLETWEQDRQRLISAIMPGCSTSAVETPVLLNGVSHIGYSCVADSLLYCVGHTGDALFKLVSDSAEAFSVPLAYGVHAPRVPARATFLEHA